MTLQKWIAETALGHSSHWWTRYLAAGVMTVASLFIVAVLWRRWGAIADPGLILLFTVAASTYLAGGMAGMLSAAIVLFSSFILFSHPQYPFRYSDLDWQQMMVVAVACPLIALMVGSLREQVDQLKLVNREAEALKAEIRRLEVLRETQFLCEQRFRLVAECLPDHALVVLDSNGMVRSWNTGAERLLGYTDPEILGQSYSRFFARDDLLTKLPERMLEQVRFTGRVEEEGWCLRKGGGRFRAKTTLLLLRNPQGAPAGSVMVVRDLLGSSAA